MGIAVGDPIDRMTLLYFIELYRQSQGKRRATILRHPGRRLRLREDRLPADPATVSLSSRGWFEFGVIADHGVARDEAFLATAAIGASMRAARRSVLANRPVARAKSRARRPG